MTVVFDLLTMGRVGVDLYPEQSGVTLAEVRTFAKSLGGSPTNVSVAAARYGHRTAVITKVGSDGFGEYVRSALQAFGVDPRFVSTHPDLRTPVVFCELHPPDHFPLLFYREPTAPDLTLTPEDLDLDAIAQARLFWTTGTGLSEEPSRSSTLAALEHRSGKPTVHDLDYRSMLWTSPAHAREQQRLALSHATIAVGNQEEAAVAVGDGTPEQLARRIQELGPSLAIVKLGPHGVLVADGDRIERLPPVSVEVRNGLGAGDAFGGALCHGLLEGWDATTSVGFANAAGAYVATQLACADAMPTEAQVLSLLDRGTHP